MSVDAGTLERRGLMLVLSSPSGAGKSTLSRLLLEGDSGFDLSISVTTRPRRASEVDGRHYHFIDAPTFRRMADEGGLLEWAEVHGNFYGTPRAPVEAALAVGRDVLFDIDWQGTAQLKANAALEADLVTVFVLPPTFGELQARLERRAEDSRATIRRRLANARVEIGKWTEYDYVMINDDVERSLTALRAIVAAERLRRARLAGLASFVDRLLAEAAEALGDADAPHAPSA
jgi:guanylate kinase